jgi:hypothetical protein
VVQLSATHNPALAIQAASAHLRALQLGYGCEAAEVYEGAAGSLGESLDYFPPREWDWHWAVSCPGWGVLPMLCGLI